MRIRVEGLKRVAALCLVIGGCSGDDDAAPSCPAGTDAGAELVCECDGSERGTQTCRSDGTLSQCECDSGDAGGAGRAGSGGGGSGGRDGGSTGGSGASGSGAGDAGPSEDEDGGSDPGTMQDGGSMADASTDLPMRGDQLSVCEDDDDCEDGLACYTEGSGRHFCTRTCDEDADCMDLTGAEYTCSDDGLCEVECMNPQDANSCPDGLSCMVVRGPGPGGPRFRCKYSANAGQSGNGEPWSACLAAKDCTDGLECVGAFGPIPGYCAQPCDETAECTEQPASGTIEPTCMQVGPMPSARACALDCSEDAEGCPDGMSCGIGFRCAH